MPPQMPMGSMLPPGMMPLSKAERDAENRMIRLESWATMIMHNMIGKLEAPNPDRMNADAAKLYTEWVAKLAFAIAAKMEEERGRLVQLPEPMGL